MLEFLNSWSDKPAEFKLDDLNKDSFSLMFQPLSGTKKTKSYINGSYSAIWPFSVIVRTANADTAHKIDARKVLENLDAWFSIKNDLGKRANLPKLTSGNAAIRIDMTSTPSIAARYDNGIDDYQAVFSLIFNHKEVD